MAFEKETINKKPFCCERYKKATKNDVVAFLQLKGVQSERPNKY